LAQEWADFKLTPAACPEVQTPLQNVPQRAWFVDGALSNSVKCAKKLDTGTLSSIPRDNMPKASLTGAFWL